MNEYLRRHDTDLIGQPVGPDPEGEGSERWTYENEDAERAMAAVLRASGRVRDGCWINGAPTHVLAELLTQLSTDGWHLRHDRQLAELASLAGRYRQERDEAKEVADAAEFAWKKCKARAEAAEAEVQRLRDVLLGPLQGITEWRREEDDDLCPGCGAYNSIEHMDSCTVMPPEKDG